MTAKKRALEIADILTRIYPHAECALAWQGDPFRLLVMGMLSAQCTDARVNLVSKDLFSRWKNAQEMANAPLDEVENAIRSCGLYKTKAKHIVRTSQILCERFGGQVPSEMEDLVSLPGVGRKIGNLIRGDVFGLGGIVADTHCIRLSARWGFTSPDVKDAVKVEKALTPLIPTEMQSAFCHRVVLFGREYCSARVPMCRDCPMISVCAFGKKKV